MGKGWLVKTILTIVIIVLLILLCGPCILQCVVNFVSHRLNSFTQIYTRKPKMQSIPMSDAHTGSWEHQEGGEWGRKGTGWADSILKKKETPSCTFSELGTMCLVAMGITYLWPNRPPRLINTRFHTKNSHCQKESNNPKRSQSPCNLYGTHWCRLQCITSWPFWLWIMAVIWLYLPLTLSRLGSRNLGMWAWAVHLRISQKLVRVLG